MGGDPARSVHCREDIFRGYERVDLTEEEEELLDRAPGRVGPWLF